MIRYFFSILLGYAIFVTTSLLLFKISGQPPHADPSLTFFILAIVYGIVFSFLSGMVTQLLSQSDSLRVNWILAFVMAGFALFSFFKSTANHWTQLLAIFIFAPVSVAGGLFYIRRISKKGL